MKLEIIKENKIISIQDIEKLEKDFDFKIPKEYKKFILEYNGGDTLDDAPTNKYDSIGLVFRLENPLYDMMKVESFFTLERVRDFLDGIREANLSNEPDYMLPYLKYAKNNMIIIGEAYNNLILCICYSEENTGKIYAIDHDHEDEFIFLSNSFDEFMNSFEVGPTEEELLNYSQ